MSDAIIKYESVSIYHAEIATLTDVSFEIQRGEFIYLIGKTGSGKSSLIKTMYADQPIRSGSATVCGYDLPNIRKKDIPYLRRKLGIIYQDFQLLPDRNAGQNLEFVLKATGWDNPKTIADRIAEVLAEVGMTGREQKRLYQLSGGEQQRLVIARALLNNPPVIIADEPTGNLDPETSNEIMNLLIRINREHNTAILMATHNYLLIEKFPNRIMNCQNQTVKYEKGIVLG
jgi:cell division transport system ATP-binding protein